MREALLIVPFGSRKILEGLESRTPHGTKVHALCYLPGLIGVFTLCGHWCGSSREGLPWQVKDGVIDCGSCNRIMRGR